jgi:hypothetical protein
MSPTPQFVTHCFKRSQFDEILTQTLLDVERRKNVLKSPFKLQGCVQKQQICEKATCKTVQFERALTRWFHQNQLP